LLRALRYDPSFGMIMQVAQFYLQNNKIERAVSVLRNATEINPASADAYYLLGVAEEKDYQYSDADKAYARAAILAPQQFRPIYSAFRRRMDSSRSDG
jgi:Flp pilus assembly protein TadD